VYEKQGKYTEALEYYFQSKKIEEDLGLGKTDDYARTLNNIGTVYDYQGKNTEALEHYFQCKKIKEELGLAKTADYATSLNNIGDVYYGKGEYCKSAEWFQKSVSIEEQIGVPSNRKNFEVAQEKCELSKPTNVEQEKKKAIDWIIKNNRWGTKDNGVVQLLTEKINTAIREKKNIWIAFGKGILKSQKVEEVYWKNNRFSVHDLSDEEVDKMELGEMDGKHGGLDD